MFQFKTTAQCFTNKQTDKKRKIQRVYYLSKATTFALLAETSLSCTRTKISFGLGQFVKIMLTPVARCWCCWECSEGPHAAPGGASVLEAWSSNTDNTACFISWSWFFCTKNKFIAASISSTFPCEKVRHHFNSHTISCHMWLEFHPSHHLGGWNTNHVVGNPTCIQRVENMMLSLFFNFENWNHIWNSQVKTHVDDGIWWVSKR